MNQPVFIENFWSSDQCTEHIQLSEQIGYERSAVNVGNTRQVVEHVRNNSRVFYESTKLAQSLWEAVKEHVPATIGNSTAIGLNELFRFYKYQPGQKFRKHHDESFIRNELEASYVTLLIYLNDDYMGGSTKFSNITFQPKTGALLLFPHNLEHSGEEVTKGIKYVLRTDVMYRLDH